MQTELTRQMPDNVKRWLTGLPTPKGSVQTQMMVVFVSFILFLLVLINSYPIISIRNVVIADKEQSMSSAASVVSSALSGLDTLTQDNVVPVLELLNLQPSTHIMVTDERKIVIYDTWGENLGTNLSATFSAVNTAFTGQIVFRSTYDSRSFTSEVCAPVMVGGNMIGSVYLVERDTEQADMISGIRYRLGAISVAVGLLAVALSLLFSRALTSRIRDLAHGLKIVQEGDYTHHITPKGEDEITDLTREFNSMTDILRQTEQSRRRFVSDASHELKTPLASIRLLSDSILQSESIDKDTTMEFVGDISQCAERLQHMTEKLLDLSRMDSGVVGERKKVDLAEIAAASLPMLRPLALRREVTLIPDIRQSVPVLAAEDDLYQIVFNLVENAIKYNQPGGSVTVTVLQEGETAKLLVSDTGIGIPPEDLPNIFGRFYRVDKARSRQAGGSGLGLSIVRDAVILHDGTIEVGTANPHGTVFTVTFPIWKGGNPHQHDR